jgi:hypothetical protein
MTPVERMLSLLEDVRARCPGHADRHGSLSIASSPTGTFFKCLVRASMDEQTHGSRDP